MPIASRCDPHSHLVIDVYHGAVSFDEWRDHVGAMLNDPTWRATNRSFSDMSSAHLPPLDDDERASMLSLFRERPLRVTGRRMAILGGRYSSVERDVERSAIDKLGARALVFTNLTAACIWLGTDERTTRSTIDELRANLHTG